MRNYTYLNLLVNMPSARRHRPSPRIRSDLILWNEFLESPELLRDFWISENVDTSIRNTILSVIETNWDSFCERGVPHPVLDFELCIDTCDTTPVCCHQPITGFTSGILWTNSSLLWWIVGWSLIAKVHGVQFYWLMLNLIKRSVQILILLFGCYALVIGL